MSKDSAGRSSRKRQLDQQDQASESKKAKAEINFGLKNNEEVEGDIAGLKLLLSPLSRSLVDQKGLTDIVG